MKLELPRAVHYRLEVYARRISQGGIELEPEQAATMFLTEAVEKKIRLSMEQWRELQEIMCRELREEVHHV